MREDLREALEDALSANHCAPQHDPRRRIAIPRRARRLFLHRLRDLLRNLPTDMTAYDLLDEIVGEIG